MQCTRVAPPVLIGDTEQMVLKHYARWVPDRQARLTRILPEALSPETETPKLVAIAGRKGGKRKHRWSGLVGFQRGFRLK